MSNPYNIQNISGDKIGDPIPSLSNELDDGYIWLEGAEVSKTTYGKLYEIYGDTYGTAKNSENFVLPDLRDRVPWGSSDGTFGYLEPKLPNITGQTTGVDFSGDTTRVGGAFKHILQISMGNAGGSFSRDLIKFNAHNSNPIYQDGATVLPPAFKGRWKTRYK